MSLMISFFQNLTIPGGQMPSPRPLDSPYMDTHEKRRYRNKNKNVIFQRRLTVISSWREK